MYIFFKKDKTKESIDDTGIRIRAGIESFIIESSKVRLHCKKTHLFTGRLPLIQEITINTNNYTIRLEHLYSLECIRFFGRILVFIILLKHQKYNHHQNKVLMMIIKTLSRSVRHSSTAGDGVPLSIAALPACFGKRWICNTYHSLICNCHRHYLW